MPGGGALKSKSSEKEDSIDPERVRSIESEKVADVGSECDRPGGVSAPGGRICDVFSESFLRLMIILMLSFCQRRESPLLHHMGLL